MSKKLWNYSLLALLLVCLLVWSSVQLATDTKFKVVFCDVGQGDAILIQYGSIQILIDGGPNDDVLGCLSQFMPFFDRTIELVILTHPQEDHYGGLIDVFSVYNVKTFLESELGSQNIGYLELKNNINNSEHLVATKGLRLKIGDIFINTLHPVSSVISSKAERSVNPNDVSVINEISFKNFKILLTGDIGPNVMDAILSKNAVSDVNILKVPHHGSKNGLTKMLLEISKPEIAVISVGKNNRFGHPHAEVLQMLENNNIKTLRTDLEGNIIIFSDGDKYWY